MGTSPTATRSRQTEIELRNSEARYRSLFAASPVAMWEEDHSLVKRHLDGLVAQGVNDIEAHLRSHPDEYAHLVRSVGVLDTNAAAVKLLGADSLDDLLAHANDLELASDEQPLAALWSTLLSGALSGSCETSCISLAGQQLHLIETCTLAPGCGETWARVFIVDVDVTKIMRMETVLRRTQQAIETASDAFYVVSPAGRFTYVNRAAAHSLGRSQEELIGVAPWEIVPALTQEQWQANWETLRDKRVVRLEAVHSAADGHLFPVEVTSNCVVLDDGEYEFTHVHDITERKRAEARLAHVNRLLRTVSDINQMIVRQTSVEALLSEACRIFVETGGFELAWIGFCSPKGKRVVPVATAGVELDALEGMDVRYDDSAKGQGPSGTAIRSGRAVVCEDAATDPMIAPWREEARGFRARSSATVPIRAGGTITGVLNVYSREPAAIPAEETALLEELADDLGYALQALENAAVREQSETALQASEARYRRIVETAAEGIMLLDAERRLTYVNAELCCLCGYEGEELTGASLDTLLFPEDVPAQLERWAERHTGATGRHEARLRCKDGSLRWVFISAQPIFDEKGGFTGALSMITDIHERKLAEERERRTTERLRLSVDAAVKTLARTIEIRDPYTAGHQERVTELALAIGERLQLRKRALTSLRIASLIHDLGKIAIPAEILARPGSLGETEGRLIQQHPETAYGILHDMRFPGPVATIVRQHHERLDGSGYPYGLRGDAIRIESRILAVADVVEAMASHRPYRPALGTDAALEEISGQRGVKYDPIVVDACVQLFRVQGFTFTDRPDHAAGNLMTIVSASQ